MLDILLENGMLGCRPVNSLMDFNSKLLLDQGDILDNPGRYMKLVGKLNYLIVTQPYIAYLVSVVSLFLSAPQTGHWDAVIQTL